MSNVQRIARNTTLLLSSSIAGFVLGFFFTVYVARYLGAQGFGVLAFALAFTAIFGVLTDIGLQALMIREIARDTTLARKYLSNIAVLKIFLTVITFGLLALTINLLHYPLETIRVVYLIALSVLFGAFSTMFYGVFRAHERMEFEALGGVLGGALLLGGALYAISHDYSIVSFALIYLIVSVITLGYCFTVSAWKFTLPRIEVDLAFWKEALKQAWPFALSGVFMTLYFSIDSVMLSSMKGSEAVGWYNAAYRLILCLLFIPIAYFGAAFPIMSRLHVTSKDFLRFTYERSFKYMLILGVPIGVGTTILASKLIMLVFGYAYYPSIIALQILVWSMVFIFINGVFGQLFNSINKQLMGTYILIGCVLFNVVLNVVLIPRYALTGASISTVVTMSLGFIINYVWSSRIGYGIPVKNTSGIVMRVLIASAVMGLPVYYFQNFYILALVPLAALLYFAVLYIIGGIDNEDSLLLRQIIGK
ncbi:MAG: flippase [Nitrososphaerota archaeon]|nr:flippase [Nitrososphaerota archaeon]